MKRVHKPHDLGPPFSPSLVESAVLRAADGQTPYTLFAPEHYEPGYAYPLVVWLHGEGQDERHLIRIMPQVSLRNYVGIGPGGIPGAARHLCGWPQTAEGIEVAEQRVFDCLEIAGRQANYAPHRVFLAGYGSGGSMAFRVAMASPQAFAGVLSFGGAFPTAGSPFRNVLAARRLPVFLAFGRESAGYGPEEACRDLRLFHTAGLSVTLRQYPCGDELSIQMLRDMDRWIIEQITSPLPPSGACSRQSCETD